MKIFNIFKNKNIPHIRFKSFIGNFSIGSPVMEARRVFSSWMKDQIATKQPSSKRFNICPGITDYAQTGFIVRAHVDIHIKANSQGVIVKLGNGPLLSTEEQTILQPAKFDFKVVDGIAPICVNSAKVANKVPLPWAVFAKPGWSAHVLPALLHSNFLDKIYVYPGTVDYDNFHVMNFVFSTIKDCEFTIYAGDPILHVIPFKRENVVGSCGKATEEEKDIQNYGFLTRRKDSYRKFFHSKKSFKMDSPIECPYHKENIK